MSSLGGPLYLKSKKKCSVYVTCKDLMGKKEALAKISCVNMMEVKTFVALNAFIHVLHI